MTVYADLAAAIQVEVDKDPGLNIPVYDNPLDNVEVPCIMVLAGNVSQATFGSGLTHELRVNCLAQRADIPGGLELADRLMRIVFRAASSLTSAAFDEALGPQVFGIASVDHMGREVRVNVSEAC